ncbi:MAG: efflux RND transporter periplasmic adaptor subunit, partial [Victivallales bacterium]|nr:efflux RND transporter periplasmic adaptor subunit [Victivallales bacterium]
PRQDADAQSGSPDRLFTVKTDDLVIGVTLSGNINARMQHKLSSDAAFKTQLISVVPENSTVKKGDVLAEFETDVLQQTIDDLKVDLDNKRKGLEILEKELEILVSSNVAEIEEAENRVVEVRDEFNKYWKIEAPKEKDTLQLNLDSAGQKLNDAEGEFYKASEVLNRTVFRDESAELQARSKLAGMEKAIDAARIALNNAELDQKMFKRFTHPNKMTTLQNKLKEAKLNLEKVKIKTASLLVQKDNQIYNQQTAITKVERDLKKHLDFLPQMRLVSPVDGIVIYCDPDRRWGKLDVKVGMDINRKQVILTIPDMSDLVVDVDIPEQYRSRVKLSDKAVIVPESLPSLRFDGVVSEIASLPKNQIHWDPFSPKIYSSKIDIVERDPRLVSGMNVKVSIVNRVLERRLVVPVEAVHEKGGKYFVYLKHDSKYREADVEIGESNDSFVEIRSGLKEGDVVFLYRPFQGKGN